MISFIKKTACGIIDSGLAFPCISCGSIHVDRKNSFCKECLDKLKLMNPPLCPACGGEMDTALDLCSSCLNEESRSWDKAISLFKHEGLGRQLVHRFKYRDTPEMARAFGLLAAKALKDTGYKPDFIVPVPLHWTRSFTRGFNQTDLVCEVLARDTGIPLRKDLKRVKRTRQQAKLSRKERRKNLIKAFSVKNEKFYKNGSILLVDDVMTTGSTLHAAAEELRNCEVREIIVMVLARR